MDTNVLARTSKTSPLTYDYFLTHPPYLAVAGRGYHFTRFPNHRMGGAQKVAGG